MTGSGTAVSGDDRVDSLLREAAGRPMTGWDFSWLGDRISLGSPPWDFNAIVARYATHSPDLLDMGTGGGEWLVGLAHRPARTIATEGWPPNVLVARARLAPLGIDVVAAGGGPDTVEQVPGSVPPPPGTNGALPFPDGSFSLITNRHESYVSAEIRRLLAPGGTFLTRQVGNRIGDACRNALRMPPDLNQRPAWTLAFATAQLAGAGMTVIDGAESTEWIGFADVGAFAWYIVSVPWLIEGFVIDDWRSRFHDLQSQIDHGEPLTFPQPVFWLAARPR